MAAFGAAILTQQGLNLIAKAQAGQAAIKFTKAAAEMDSIQMDKY